MFKLGLLSAGFSAILGQEVVLQEGEATYSIHDVLRETYVMKPPGYRLPSAPKPAHDTFPIIVRGFFGFADGLTLQVRMENSVLEMKLQIQEKVQIAETQFYLIYDNKRLENDRTVKDYGLQPESIIRLALRLKGGAGPLTVSTDELDPKFDHDFTGERDDGNPYMRGGFEYKRPYGWMRYAIRVLGRYGNDDWLGPNGVRTGQASGEWPVSYHGTDMSSAKMIVKEGYKVGPGAMYGQGIYTSPSLEMVEMHGYAKEFLYDGKRYKIALQNRVNPDRDGHLEIVSASRTAVGADYWLSRNKDDVRPYGLLFREVGQTESCSL